MIFEKEGKLFFQYDNEMVCIEAWGPNALRVRATKNAEFNPENWALESSKGTKGIIKISKIPAVEVPLGGPGGSADTAIGTISSGTINAVINSTGHLIFTNSKGETLLEEFGRMRGDMPHTSLNLPARELYSLGGSSFKLACRFQSNNSEKIFGMGQYQQKFLDQKGNILELAHRNSQASVPFYISSLGYGFLWNNPAIGKVTFGKNYTEWTAQSTNQIDYWVIAGDSPDEIECAYMDAVGHAPMMPDYGIGFWQCKLRYKTQEEILKVARKHKQLGLPMDVIVVDFFHWTQQGEYKFDPKYWPDPGAMCRELKELGIEVMVSIWPTVDYRSENFREMMEKGYLVRVERGVRVTMQAFGQEVFMDPTNPGTREFVWNKVKQNYWDKGVRLFWLDEAEPEYSVYDYDNYRYYLGTDLEVGNIYPKMYAKMFFDGMKSSGMANPMNLLRCAWAGSAKYGTLVWSGDIDTTFETLQRQIRAGLSMAIAGIPWWTTDIGGFMGARFDDPQWHKVLQRWFAYGCFSPVFRLHGVRNPQKMSGPGSDFITGTGEFGSGADNEVWSFGEDVFKVLKKYLLLRERLRPYIKEQMKLTADKGTPIMRPLFYDFPKDAAVWNVDDAYMFGPDILVAPVMEDNEDKRKVYLPDGATWTNAWTGESFGGGRTVSVPAPIDIIPLFLKNNAKLPIKD
jgi:alpha-D-xyloside xylohydrolase